MRTVNNHSVALQAHRGVSTDCPENTMAAFRAAVEQGYDIIELDPKFTKDNRCVALHDRTINRTGRAADGSAPAEDTRIDSLTLAEALSFEYGSWQDAAFAGEKLPLLEEVFAFAKAHQMPLKLDNVIQSFTDEQTGILFDLVGQAGMELLAGFTCTEIGYLQQVVARFPQAPIHYDGWVDEEHLAAVRSALKQNELTVWLPYPNRLTGWCRMPAASEERVKLVRGMGAKLGVWILSDEADMIDACDRFKPDYIETTGSIKPDQ